jgi:hypothetical protein
MSRPKRDRRPVRSDSKATAPARAIPEGWFKCQLHGATLPVEQMQPGLPPEWQCCKPCWAKSRDVSNKCKNPGEAVELSEVAR